MLRRPVLGSQGQRILDVGNIFLKHCQLLTLGIIAYQHRSAIGALNPEKVVVVGFVGSKNDVKFRAF